MIKVYVLLQDDGDAGIKVFGVYTTFEGAKKEAESDAEEYGILQDFDMVWKTRTPYQTEYLDQNEDRWYFRIEEHEVMQ